MRFRYADSPTDALAGVNLTVAPGEFLAVLGGNGSGKSTLARVVGGLLLPAEGRVLVAGLDTRDPSARIEVRRRIGLVFQNPDNQIVAALVEDDIAFGPENLGVPPEEIGRRVAAALAAVGMSEYARRDPHHLSGGQKQRVAIAAALAMQPDCVCLDEPTSLLDPVGRAEALAAIHALHSAGGAVILITHHAAEAAAADRAVVLAAGRVVADAPPAQLFADPARLRAWGVEPPPAVAAWAVLRGRGLDVPGPCLTMERLAEGLDRLALQTANPPAASAAASGGQASASAAPSPPLQPGSAAGGASSARAPWGGGTLAPAAPGPAALQPARADHAGAAAGRGPLPPERPPLPPRGLALDTVRFTYPDPAVPIRRRRPAVDGVDLRLAPGECLALLGATGSGKSTLALLACTLLRPDAGVLVVDGEQPWRVAPRARRGALRRARRMVGLVFQHPEDQFFEERVLDEVSFAPRNYGASPAHAAAAAREALRRAGLADELAERSPFHLSGGQMRRVAIAALLAAGPRYLLLDEPTAGLDADGRAAVIALVRELRSAGVGILLITHRMEEAAALADRVAILHGGELVAAGSMRDVFALGERLTEWGLHPPAAAELLEALRRRGWRLPPAALTLEEACRAIVGAAAASGAPIRPPAPSQRGAGAAPDGPGEGAPACSPA